MQMRIEDFYQSLSSSANLASVPANARHVLPASLSGQMLMDKLNLKDKHHLSPESLVALRTIEKAILSGDLPAVEHQLANFQDHPLKGRRIMKVVAKDLTKAGINARYYVGCIFGIAGPTGILMLSSADHNTMIALYTNPSVKSWAAKLVEVPRPENVWQKSSGNLLMKETRTASAHVVLTQLGNTVVNNLLDRDRLK